nr:Os03g0603200 [Ipomoea batatas]GMD70426.1 Os03g0603200 [Ipomoea batatas]GMD96805.1 Os03g0603200 [Ipomoea batatas]
MARSNMSSLADSFMGRSEKEVPQRISLAVSGWLLMIIRVVPRLNAIKRFRPIEAAIEASLRVVPPCKPSFHHPKFHEEREEGKGQEGKKSGTTYC